MPFRSLDTGACHTCGVRVDGAVDCWGSYYHIKGFGLERLEDPGILEPPERFCLARAGGAYPCGLNTAGTPVCWERDGNAADITPPRRFKAVSAGRYHTCRIETDGTLACWGTQESGAVMNPPSGLFAAVSVAHRHACALELGGRAVRWSYDSDPSSLAPPDPDAVFKSVSTGGYLDGYRVCGIKADDTVACWAPALMRTRLAPAPSGR